MYRVQGPAERLMENVANPRASTQLGGLNIPRGTLNGWAVRARELCDDLQ